MAIKVYFGDTLIPENAVMGISKTAKLFDNIFFLGSTLCKSYELKIAKEAVQTQPNRVYLRNEDGDVLANLYVDNINTEDEQYYTYDLVDGMIKFNQYYDWSSLSNPTVQSVLEYMCYNVLGTNAPTVSYIGNLPFPYTDGITCREFISYIAEINGCFAKIDGNNALVFVAHNQAPTKTLYINTCADIKVGQIFKFDRVVLNNGIDTVKYPDDLHYTGTGTTLYLNPDNMLITDTDSFTIEGIVEHIYTIINGYTFFNFTTSMCRLNDSIEAGENIYFDFGTEPLTTEAKQILETQAQEWILANNGRLVTIAQLEWDYNKGWVGGFDLNVISEKQEETQVVSNTDRIRRLSIKVDKENGEIRQEISNTNGDVSRIIQDASSLTGYFESATGARYIKLSSDGIKVSKNPQSDDYASVNITDDGVYIKNDDNQIVASMRENEFDTTNWIYSETRSGNCLNIYKRRI